jgi:hypothetical protein
MTAVRVGRRVAAEIDPVRCARVWFIVITVALWMYRRRECGAGLFDIFASYQRSHELL